MHEPANQIPLMLDIYMRIELKRVIYISERPDFSGSCLEQVIISSKKNDPEENITACLLAENNSFLHLLEGSPFISQ